MSRDATEYAWTDAPVGYDYDSVVEHVGQMKDKHGVVWRLVNILDNGRFLSFQTPRYNSGFYAILGGASPAAVNLGLSVHLPAVAGALSETRGE